MGKSISKPSEQPRRESNPEEQTPTEVKRIRLSASEPTRDSEDPIKRGCKDSTKRDSMQDSMDLIKRDSTMNYQFYQGDLVYKIDEDGRFEFGSVLGATDSDDFGQNKLSLKWSSSWFLNSDICKANEIGLIDRKFSIGDRVRRKIPGRNGFQYGYCRSVDKRCDMIVAGTNYIMQSVDLQRIDPIWSLGYGSLVYLDSYVGVTKGQSIKVILRSTYGARFEIPYDQFGWFINMDSGKCDCYPGGEVVGPVAPATIENLCLLKPSKPLKLDKCGKLRRGKFTVEDVYVEKVEVIWLSKADSISATLPENIISGKNLKRLKLLSPICISVIPTSVGLPISYEASDTMIKRVEWYKAQAHKYKDAYQNQLLNNKMHRAEMKTPKKTMFDEHVLAKSENSQVVEILAPETDMKSKHIDENGCITEEEHIVEGLEGDDENGWITEEEHMDEGLEGDDENGWTTEEEHIGEGLEGECSTTTASNVSISHRMNKNIQTIKKLLKTKTTVATVREPEVGDRLYVESFVDYTTANIVWQDGSVEHNVPSTDLLFAPWDSREFFPGDYVSRSTAPENEMEYMDMANEYGVIQTVDHEQQTTIVKWFTPYNLNEEPIPKFKGESEVSVYGIRDHELFKIDSGELVRRVGNALGEDANSIVGVVMYCHVEGRVEVKWADGHCSPCWPQDLRYIGPKGSQFEDWETEFENSSDDEVDQKTTPCVCMKRKIYSLRRLHHKIPTMPEEELKEALSDIITSCEKGIHSDKTINTKFFASDYLMILVKRAKILLENSSTSPTRRTSEPPVMPLNTPELHGKKAVQSLEDADINLQALQQDSGNFSRSEQFVDNADTPNVQCNIQASPTKNDSVRAMCAELCALVIHHIQVYMEHTLTEESVEDPQKCIAPNRSVSPSSHSISGNVPEIFASTSIDDSFQSLPSDPVAYDFASETFQLLPEAPENHYYYSSWVESMKASFYKAVMREHKVLQTSLPPGVWVKVYEDHLELLSIMIAGPANTPYEDGLFFIDMLLNSDYPNSPPKCHFINYSADPINPNLYETGTVCISLLGTWKGHHQTEIWTPQSTILQVIVSIQGLILVAEPYFNEPGYEKQKGTLQGEENSRAYNEMVIVKVVEATVNMLENAPQLFRQEILHHFYHREVAMLRRITGWSELYEKQEVLKQQQRSEECVPLLDDPGFPLSPVTRGFHLGLAGVLAALKKNLYLLCRVYEMEAMKMEENLEFHV